MCMRTNIVLDTKLVDQALKLSGIKTKREVVQFALQELVQNYHRQEIRQYRGKLNWEGDLNEMRLTK